MITLSSGQAEHRLAVRAFSVAEALYIADAVFCKNEKALKGLKQLQKYFVLAASFINVSRQHSVYHQNENCGLQKGKEYSDKEISDEKKHEPQNEIKSK